MSWNGCHGRLQVGDRHNLHREREDEQGQVYERECGGQGMTGSSPRCFAMKAAFKSEVLVQELIGVVAKSTTHPPCQKIGLELLEVGMHRSFVLPHMARPPAPPMSRQRAR